MNRFRFIIGNLGEVAVKAATSKVVAKKKATPKNKAKQKPRKRHKEPKEKMCSACGAEQSFYDGLCYACVSIREEAEMKERMVAQAKRDREEMIKTGKVLLVYLGFMAAVGALLYLKNKL